MPTLQAAAPGKPPPARSAKKAPARKAPPKKAPRKPAPKPGPVAIEGAGALRPFFAQLAALKEPTTPPGTVARILFFGDSHTAADFWPGRLRAQLQAVYGDGGPGLLLPARPWRGYPHEGVEQDFGRRWPGESLRSAEGTGRVGLAGAALEIPPGERYEVRGAIGGFAIQVFGVDGLHPLLAPPELSPEEPPPPPIPLRETERMVAGEGLSLRTYLPADPGPWGSLSLGLPEGLRLLGLDLRSGRTGVVLDELGINGAELTDLERWDPLFRRALLDQARPALLVLAYGTNDLGRRDLDGAAYRQRAARLFRSLMEESGAPLLLLGPLDRQGRRRRGQNFKAGAATVLAAMRGACADAGCAFWDVRAAMGGPGSMARWRKERLAQRDLVHLTAAGYQKLGDLLHRALEQAREGWAKDLAE